MFFVDQFVYSNKMRLYHPGEKAAFAIGTMAITLIFKNVWVHLLVIGIMLGFLIFRAKIPRYVVLKLMMIPFSFLLVGVVAIAVDIGHSSNLMLASLKIGPWYFGVTEGSLKTAGTIVLQSLSSITCLYFLALTIPMVELIYLLQKLRLPVIFVELMMLIYRFIFVFIDTAFSIYTAQSSRWGYCSFKRSIYSFGILFANLWSKVFFKSQALFNSLLSRGYEGDLTVLNPKYRFSWENIVIYTLIDLGLIIIALI